MPAKFPCEVEDITVQRGLDRPVGPTAAAAQRRHRGKQHHPAAALLKRLAQRFHQQDRGEHVGFERSQPVLADAVQPGRALPARRQPARRGHDAGTAALRGADALRDRRGSRRGRQVGADRIQAGGQFPGEPFERPGPPPRREHMKAGRDQPVGHCPADAGTRTTDHDQVRRVHASSLPLSGPARWLTMP